jgi:hypothetical protein
MTSAIHSILTAKRDIARSGFITTYNSEFCLNVPVAIYVKGISLNIKD